VSDQHDPALGGSSDELPSADLAARMKEAREQLGLKRPADLAERIGISARTYEGYEQGRSPPKVATLRGLAELGVDLNWLLTGEGTAIAPIQPMINSSLPRIARKSSETHAIAMFASATELGPEFVLLPRYEVRAAAGGGAVVSSEQIVDHLAFKTDWVRHTLRRNPANLILIEAMGDSMEPTIADGDLLLVDTTEGKVRDNAIYALSVDGDLIVKRVQRAIASGGVTIISDNPRYQPQQLDAREVTQLRVIGQVCWHGGVL